MTDINNSMYTEHIEQCSKLINDLEQLIIYRNLLKDPVITALLEAMRLLACHSEAVHSICAKLSILLERLYSTAYSLNLSGNIYSAYLIQLIINDENVFTLHSERYGPSRPFPYIDAVESDLLILNNLISFDLNTLTKGYMNCKTTDTAAMSVPLGLEPMLESELSAAGLAKYHYTNGSGVFNASKMLRLDDNSAAFCKVDPCDDVRFSDIIGYEHQKHLLIQNTKAFIAGIPANNCLVIGDRGTGKSSCIKALASEFHTKGLRLIELHKHQLRLLPNILGQLSRRGMKNIIFIDDLSFEEFEIEYKILKSYLEGGAQKQPENILFYATSNKRHIISEHWKDRSNSEADEVHASDVANEKLSLSDRFGLTITFPRPTHLEYLEIVAAIAEREGITPTEEIKAEAIKWELNRHGLSGRTAKQFIINKRILSSELGGTIF